uniref:Uncharacterized protein n=1 Tax=Trichuris muris TaxID=70415 RepID=A0A5S6QCG3_TRIMR
MFGDSQSELSSLMFGDSQSEQSGLAKSFEPMSNESSGRDDQEAVPRLLGNREILQMLEMPEYIRSKSFGEQMTLTGEYLFRYLILLNCFWERERCWPADLRKLLASLWNTMKRALEVVDELEFSNVEEGKKNRWLLLLLLNVQEGIKLLDNKNAVLENRMLIAKCLSTLNSLVQEIKGPGAQMAQTSRQALDNGVGTFSKNRKRFRPA